MSRSKKSVELALHCAKAAIDKKANHNLIFEVGKLGAFTDFFMITSGSNEKQVQAIADEMSRQAREAGFSKPHIEGYEEGRWVLVDFGDVVCHVFHDYIREFYDLEALWGEAPRVAIPEEFYKSAAPVSASGGSVRRSGLL